MPPQQPSRDERSDLSRVGNLLGAYPSGSVEAGEARCFSKCCERHGRDATGWGSSQRADHAGGDTGRE